ncbi:hypothetical protein [Mesonia maritima]|uniref:Uncharacterized protein n=1 Tax=Mesonia maritima TaxID=1793873 RepID=A0ABU1K1D8_9FLAO|nr:hypothetical protein [Mesonia maritima]MDR6299422.1 hypothetical protein [Mesonia maritima]
MDKSINRIDKNVELLIQRLHQNDAIMQEVSDSFKGVDVKELNNQLKKYNENVINDQNFYEELLELQETNFEKHKKLKNSLQQHIANIPEIPSKVRYTRETIFDRDSKKNLKNILYSISITTIIVFYGFKFIEQASINGKYQIAYEQLYHHSSEEKQNKLKNRLVEAENKHSWYEKALIYIENW